MAENLTATEAAALLSVHPDTLNRWANEGKVRHWITPGGQHRYRLEDIEALPRTDPESGVVTALEPYAQGDRHRLRQLVTLSNASNLIPDSFKVSGVVQWGDVALACDHAEYLGLNPVQDIGKFPVIKGQVFPMAEIWVLMANRHGWEITTPVDTAERVVVHMEHPDKTPRDFEMTLDEARQLGSAKTNPNYKDGTARSMVRARALLTAIRVNAPEVMRDPYARQWGANEISAADAVAEQGDARDLERGPVSVSTSAAEPITPPRRPVPDAARVRLIEAIEGLPDPTKDDLRRACVDVELPNVMSSDLFNLCDAALLERLITEALARAEMFAYTEEEMAPFEP